MTYTHRQTLTLTQGDPHRIYIRDADEPEDTFALIQLREGVADEAPVALEYVREGITDAGIVYLAPPEATAVLRTGSDIYVWEMQLDTGGDSTTVANGGVIVRPEIARDEA